MSKMESNRSDYVSKGSMLSTPQGILGCKGAWSKVRLGCNVQDLSENTPGK